MDPESNYWIKGGFNGYTTTRDLICKKCGALIIDTTAHDQFHEDLRR